MARPRKKPEKPTSLGAKGKRVRQQTIAGHQMEINKLKAELKKIKDPVQKRLLIKQILLEGMNLERFKRQTR